MLDMVQIGKRIADYRIKQGLTQQELAKQLFVTHQAVSKWEQGKSMPSIELLHNLTTLFHTSIDALLDASDIEENDYDTLFQNYSRDIIINQFLNQPNQNQSIHQLFYRLNQKERLTIIQHLIYHQGDLSVDTIWPYLNQSERAYLLGAILSGTLDYNLQPIVYQLTNKERNIAQKKHEDGSYPYPLSFHYNINKTE
jgi:transcriptional regulator with XRE-family HTH domain